MSIDVTTNFIYDREQTLRSRLNVFLNQRLHLPERDYYGELDQETLSELKSVLSDINNIFTMRVCIGFAKWLGESLGLGPDARERIEFSILRTPPNANGFDLEISDPVKVIAEIKCNVPINSGAVYGSAQRNGLTKDVQSLIGGKSKSRMIPDECLKFLVLLDTPNIRKATEHFVRNLKQHQDRIVFVSSDVRPENKDKIYLVYVNKDA